MSTPSISRTCTQCLRASRIATRTTSTTSASRRAFQTSTPLYLDFLAPSWHSQPTATSQPSIRSRASTPRHESQIAPRRPFSSTPRHAAKAITNPRKDDSGEPMTITITPRAAHRLEKISAQDSNPDLALRVAVESGGCHGFQYLMSLVNAKEIDAEEDTVFEEEEVQGGKGEYKAKVVMDEPSLELLRGSSVDYTMELIGSQFKVVGIPGAKSSCGCGTSFDIAA